VSARYLRNADETLLSVTQLQRFVRTVIVITIVIIIARDTSLDFHWFGIKFQKFQKFQCYKAEVEALWTDARRNDSENARSIFYTANPQSSSTDIQLSQSYSILIDMSEKRASILTGAAF